MDKKGNFSGDISTGSKIVPAYRREFIFSLTIVMLRSLISLSLGISIFLSVFMGVMKIGAKNESSSSFTIWFYFYSMLVRGS